VDYGWADGKGPRRRTGRVALKSERVKKKRKRGTGGGSEVATGGRGGRGEGSGKENGDSLLCTATGCNESLMERR